MYVHDRNPNVSTVACLVFRFINSRSAETVTVSTPARREATLAVMNDYHLHHVSVAVPDLLIAISWYSDLFGLTVERSFDIPEIPARGVFVSGEGLRLELWQPGTGGDVPAQRQEPHSDLAEGGTKHIGFAVRGLGDHLRRIADRGVRVVAVQRRRGEPMQPVTGNDFGSEPFAAFIADPFGSLIELLDSGLLPTDEPGDQP